MGCNPMYSLTWGEFGTSLQSTVQMMRSHGDFVDVTLTAGGKLYPAHKIVLSAASPLLMELLKSTQCQHPVLVFAGIASSDLEALLQFVYHGEVSVDTDQLPSLLQAAQCLDIQALSPASLSSEKIRTMIMSDHSGHGIITPTVSVRKKKKKPRPLNSTRLDGFSDDLGETSESDKDNINLKKSSLMSDLPVSCNICGIILRQSRNLKRHIELIHSKPEVEKIKKPKIKLDSSAENSMNGTQTEIAQEVPRETKTPEEGHQHDRNTPVASSSSIFSQGNSLMGSNLASTSSLLLQQQQLQQQIHQTPPAHFSSLSESIYRHLSDVSSLGFFSQDAREPTSTQHT